MAQPEVIKDIDARVKIAGDTMTGNLKGKYFQGTWLQTTDVSDLGSSPPKIAVISSDGWIYYRTPSELASDIGLTGNYVLKSGDTMTGNLTAPTFIGSLQGNASSSTYSTFTYFQDTRNVNEMPLDMLKGISLHLKASSVDEISDGSSYHPVLMLRDWNDLTGGPFAELTITGNQNLYFRTSKTNTNTWDSWRKVLTDYNYKSVLNNTYLPLTGGILTGRLYIKIMDNQILLGNDQYKKAILRNDGSDFWLLVSNVGSNEFNDLRPFRFNLSSGQVYISHGLNITGGTFNYSSIQSGSSNADRNVWFSTSGSRGTPCFNDNFKYNPATNTLTVSNITGNALSATTASKANTLGINAAANLSGCLQYIQQSEQTSGNDLPTATWHHVLKMNHGVGDAYYKRLLAFEFWDAKAVRTAVATGDGKTGTWFKFWLEGDSVTGAVWNDYAECREADTIEPGYVLVETGDDSLTKSTERLSPFAGVSSDTWGFSQGETDKAKTPIAVAGRVLVYPWQDRNNYKPGDCVCAAPEGKVDIMTREEIIQYPDRIVGTVSSVPTYDKWGGGEKADREPVDVNGRIWIKIK